MIQRLSDIARAIGLAVMTVFVWYWLIPLVVAVILFFATKSPKEDKIDDRTT